MNYLVGGMRRRLRRRSAEEILAAAGRSRKHGKRSTEGLAAEVLLRHPDNDRSALSLHRASVLPRVGAGVYFLLLDGVVVFVGSSREVSSRVQDHCRSPVKFDRVLYFSLPQGRLLPAELAFIKHFRPVHNPQSLTAPPPTPGEVEIVRSLLGRG